jgi:hypothetical protein
MKSLSSLARNNGFNLRKLINFLIKYNIIYEKRVGKEILFVSNNRTIVNREKKEDKLEINEKNFLRFIQNKDVSELYLTEYDKNINQLTNNRIKLERLNIIKNKKLMFIDFEYRDKYFYEVAFVIVENGVIIEKEYIFTQEATRKNRVLQKMNNFIDTGIKFKIMQKSKIDYILRKKVKEVDAILGYHVNAEMNVLKHINIDVKKYNFVCVAELYSTVYNFRKGNKIKEYPSLNELYNFIKKDTKVEGYKHCAIYDTLLAKICFDSLFDILNNNIDKYPLIVQGHE